MAQAKNRLGKIDSLVSLADWVWRNLSSLVTAIAGGGFMTRWAATTEWASGFGPLGWGLVGLATFLAIMAVMTWWVDWSSKARLRTVQTRMSERLLSSATVNPLETRFYRQIVRLSDFITADGHPRAGQTFEECEIIGPGVVVLVGCDYSRNTHSMVEFVKIGSFIPFAPTKIILSGATIKNCTIYSAIFLVPADHLEAFEKGFVGDIPWMN